MAFSLYRRIFDENKDLTPTPISDIESNKEEIDDQSTAVSTNKDVNTPKSTKKEVNFTATVSN